MHCRYFASNQLNRVRRRVNGFVFVEIYVMQTLSNQFSFFILMRNGATECGPFFLLEKIRLESPYFSMSTLSRRMARLCV